MQLLSLAQLVTSRSDGRRRLDWRGANEIAQSSVWRGILSSAKRDVLFDLSGFDYLNNDGLLWLLLLAERLRERAPDSTPWLELPRDQAQLRYIKSSGFDRVASELFMVTNVYLVDSLDVRESKAGMRFYRVDIESLPAVMRDFGSLLSSSQFVKSLGMIPLDETSVEFFPAFYQVVTETPKNIVQHSRDTATAGSGYMVTSELGFGVTRICVGDTGRGFRASLQAKGTKAENDFDAIREALLYHYNHREGEGLFRVLQFVSQLKGLIKIRSGSCETRLDLRQRYLADDEDAKVFLENEMLHQSVHPFGGVQLLIDVRRPGSRQ